MKENLGEEPKLLQPAPQLHASITLMKSFLSEMKSRHIYFAFGAGCSSK